MALLAAFAPATFTSLIQDSDAQIAVFVVPLTLLFFAIVFEVTRFAMRGTSLPGDAPRRRARARRHWKPGHGEG